MYKAYRLSGNPSGFLLRMAETVMRIVGAVAILSSLYTLIREGRLLASLVVLFVGLLMFWSSINTFQPDIFLDSEGIRVYVRWKWKKISWSSFDLKRIQNVNLIISGDLPAQYYIYGFAYFPGWKCFGISAQTDADHLLKLIAEHKQHE